MMRNPFRRRYTDDQMMQWLRDMGYTKVADRIGALKARNANQEQTIRSMQVTRWK